MDGSNRLTVGPETEPVSLEEIKTFARIGGTSEDDLLESLIKAARVWCESYVSCAFIEQTWRMTLAHAPCGRALVLPRGPLMRLSSMRIYDAQDAESVWDTSNVVVDTQSVPGKIVLREGAVWPLLRGYAGAMVVEYVAGYGADAQDVPEDIRLAVKQLALHWHENRDVSASKPDVLRVPVAVEALLRPYRLYGVGGTCR